MKKYNTDDFIEKANVIHKNRYDYSKLKYINSKTKVCIVCPEHGEFWQMPLKHLKGQGCIKCYNEKRNTILNSIDEEFIEKAIKVHGNKYNYSKVEYTNSHTKVCIICPEHGEFWQTPANHLNGHGCKKCAIEIKSESQKSSTEEFICKANKIHLNKYDYSQVKYNGNRRRVNIICQMHGMFLQTPLDHLQGCGCPKCVRFRSKNETEICNLLKPLRSEENNRSILNGKEIDIYISKLKLGIEYNGLRWHSEEFGKDKNYHLNKLNECNKQGIGLIQIFEDEWVNHREICESKLKQICGLNNNPKIYARKCEVIEIEKQEAYSFLEKNHIQGKTGFTVGLGAYYEGNLVGVMAFKREKDGYWDLNRFATDINFQCIGIGGKLFKYFITNYDFTEIKSFADRRWTINPSDNLYTKLGFSFDSYVPPSYWYYNNKMYPYERFHKFGFRKQPLHKKYGLSLEMTELEMTKSLGYTRIWDCGLIKYVYKHIYK